jgi:hypothetical protein
MKIVKIAAHFFLYEICSDLWQSANIHTRGQCANSKNTQINRHPPMVFKSFSVVQFEAIPKCIMPCKETGSILGAMNPPQCSDGEMHGFQTGEVIEYYLKMRDPQACHGTRSLLDRQDLDNGGVSPSLALRLGPR